MFDKIDEAQTIASLLVLGLTLIGLVYGAAKGYIKKKKDSLLEEEAFKDRLGSVEVKIKEFTGTLDRLEEYMHDGDVRHAEMSTVIEILSVSTKDLDKDLKDIIKMMLDRH